ncbi:MAG TPA: 3-oxoacyl-ACP reductase FabG [Casimicrobiaceae bacterium]|nr:3-oxoacyl-ACP reductase FabG [Casimicrobiaceae bacterium]
MALDGGFAGKVVVVTGGSRGIGRAIVELFAAEGADVTFFYAGRNDAAAEVVASAKSRNQLVEAMQVDVRDSAACKAAAERIANAKGRIDVLINNAGVIRDNVLIGLDDEDISTVLDVNVKGVFNVTRAIAPYMISKRSGKIVMLSSVSGAKGGRGQTNYAASKGAIDGLTRALAAELGSRKINVNAVAPGVIETDMSERVRELAGEEIKSRILLKRFGQPRDVAQAVWFLASGLADYVTGQVLYVDGGFKME